MFKIKFPLYNIHVFDECGMLRKSKEMYHQFALMGQTDKDAFEEALEEFERPDEKDRSHTNLPLDEKAHQAVKQIKDKGVGKTEKSLHR